MIYILAFAGIFFALAFLALFRSRKPGILIHDELLQLSDEEATARALKIYSHLKDSDFESNRQRVAVGDALQILQTERNRQSLLKLFHAIVSN